ncbi:VENN motif pre-toxin domain-containing protein [Paralysiella testudinis]|uniref:VENN motif pre-toxin domain-containing protein n=1 Tax=Paralysiella testudinis TaxID=2809020 RepID=UPI001E4AFCA7|nr:VENN motif pre-toxin domain-containing protein [Paralysiella testudinis]
MAKWLYGTDNPDKLSAEQKATTSSITGLGGAAVGAVTGSSTATDAVSGSRVAQNAVENNNQAAALRVVGVPAIAAIYCAVDKSCASATDAFKDILAEQMAETQRERDAIFADTLKDKGNKDKGTVSTEGGTSTATPSPPPEDDQQDHSSIDHIVKNSDGSYVGNVSV